MDECLVYLQRVHGTAAQSAEPRAAGTEVVDGEAYAEAPEAGQDVEHLVRTGTDHALGDLELKLGRVKPALAQRLGHVADERGIEEIASRQVDRDA